MSLFNAFIFLTILLSRTSSAQNLGVDTTSSSQSGGADGASSLVSQPSTSSATAAISGTTTTFRPIFTVPAAADVGASLIPNINDPEAVDAQVVCPGYTASNVVRTPLGLVATLSLAGIACNVYGTDVETLDLTIQYQSADRLSIQIVPAIIDASNASQYLLPDHLIYLPTADADAITTSLTNELDFTWSNEPTFSFSVFRKSTGDTLFSTEGTKLVYENQFIEFVSSLPEEYNLYGLGEVIHGLRLGNNFTRTIFAADSGDPVD